MKRFIFVSCCLLAFWGLAGFVLSQPRQSNDTIKLHGQVNTVGLVAHYKLWADLVGSNNIGPELVTNGDFEIVGGGGSQSTTVFGTWTNTVFATDGSGGGDEGREVSNVDPGQSHGGTTAIKGACNIWSENGVLSEITQAGILTAGLFHIMTLDVLIASGSIKVYSGSAPNYSEITTSGTKTFSFKATNTDILIGRNVSPGETDVTIDNVSIRELTGEVFDYALNGNMGTVTGAVPVFPGFLFDADDDEIDCGSGSSIDDIFVGGGTVSIWLLSDGRGENNQGSAIGKGEWQFQMITDTTTMKLVREFLSGAGGWEVTITAGVWQHIVICYDSSLATNDPVIYLNGVSTTVTETAEPGGSVVSDAEESLFVGDTAGSTGAWDGKIGDVMLFDKTKTAAEIKSIFELTRWRYGV